LNHAIEIELRVRDGDLALAEGIVERLIDCLGRDAEARGRVAVERDAELQARSLLIGGHVFQLGQLAQSLDDFGRPLFQLVQICILDGVLVLRTRRTAPHT